MSKIELTDKEQKLIELLRQTRYGQIVIYLEEGQPIRIERIRESVKL